MLLRVVIVVVVVGLLIGVLSPVEVGEALRGAWDWLVDTVTGIMEGASR